MILYRGFGVKQGQRHDGIDLSAPEGTIVRAAAAGEVIYTGNQDGYGTIVMLRHAGSLITLYAHNSAVLVKHGDRVEAGTPVAKVGHVGAHHRSAPPLRGAGGDAPAQSPPLPPLMAGTAFEVESAAMESIADLLRRTIRDVPDFPKKGIVFKDITPVLGDAAAYRRVVDELVTRWKPERIDQVVGIESRGFIFAAPLAYALGAGLSIARKPGKLPWETIRESYPLEYGEDGLELHIDSVEPGERVLVVDDLLATGGTAGAVGRLVTRQGAELVGYAVVVELAFLDGRRRLGARQGGLAGDVLGHGPCPVPRRSTRPCRSSPPGTRPPPCAPCAWGSGLSPRATPPPARW